MILNVLLWVCLLLSIPFSNAEIVFVKQNSSPKYFDSESKQIGLCDEVYLTLQTRLEKLGQGAHIDPTLYPIKRTLGLLLSGKGHVFCGAGRNKEREQLYHYSEKPVYSVSNVLLMHNDDKYIANDYRDLQENKLLIGTYFGTSSSKFLKKLDGIRVLDHFTNLNDAIEQVASKKIPYFYYHDLGLNYLVKQ